MGKYFELTLQTPRYQVATSAAKRREQVAEVPVQLQAWHGIVIAAAVLGVALYYLVLANSGATASYRITMMQNDMSSMIQQQKKLETERSELQSMQSIQSNPVVTAMVPVTSVTYLSQ